MTRCEALCKVLGWQDGTIHQVATEVGCEAHRIIYRDLFGASLDDLREYGYGFDVAKDSPQPALFLPAKRGSLMFWIGVADSIRAGTNA